MQNLTKSSNISHNYNYNYNYCSAATPQMSSTNFLPKMPALSASSLFTTYASLSAMLMLFRSIFNEFIPKPAREFLVSLLGRLFNFKSAKLTLVFEELNSNGIGRNHFYDVAEVYLSHKIQTPSTDRLKISKSPKDKTPTIRFEKGEQIQDSFDGIALRWNFCCLESEKRRRSFDDETGSSVSLYETRFFELSFEKQFQSQVIHSYLPFIEAKYKVIKDKERRLKLHTLGYKYSGANVYWDTTNLDHPSTFDTLAMDPDRKSAIIDDLDRFVRRREFYRKVGRAWKRGYLLFGPPGTGKSSLVAAMANYLRFDIYDLQLGNLMRDSDLRRVLLSIPNRSILVIEDIDCSVEIKDRRKNISPTATENGHQYHPQGYKPLEPQLSLSGLLNFIDGLWSSCGDERIIVFTTNHKDKLDPALLRPGRMDMHIEMSYLTVGGFRILTSNYLETKGTGHPIFQEIEDLIPTTKVTPAEVAEELMRTEGVDEALGEVLKLLNAKKEMMNDVGSSSSNDNDNDDDDNGNHLVEANGNICENGKLDH